MTEIKLVLVCAMAVALVVCFSFVGGCASRIGPQAPNIVTQRVKVAVPVSCVPKEVPGKLAGLKVPFSADDLLKAPDDVLLKELYADYRIMGARLGILDPVERGCE